MGESGRETAVSSRKEGVLTLGFLPCDDGLVKATKLNKGIPNLLAAGDRDQLLRLITTERYD
jgi:hypothetical protein